MRSCSWPMSVFSFFSEPFFFLGVTEEDQLLIGRVSVVLSWAKFPSGLRSTFFVRKAQGPKHNRLKNSLNLDLGVFFFVRVSRFLWFSKENHGGVQEDIHFIWDQWHRQSCPLYSMSCVSGSCAVAVDFSKFLELTSISC